MLDLFCFFDRDNVSCREVSNGAAQLLAETYLDKIYFVPERDTETFVYESKPYAYSTIDTPKMLRETLCLAYDGVNNLPMLEGREHHLDRLQRLIDECDRKRPFGADGTHGDKHTETAGVSNG